MDGQENLRQQVQDYVTRHGSRYKWFCEQIGISSTHLSLWLRGDRTLGENTATRLSQILDQ